MWKKLDKQPSLFLLYLSRHYRHQVYVSWIITFALELTLTLQYAKCKCPFPSIQVSHVETTFRFKSTSLQQYAGLTCTPTALPVVCHLWLHMLPTATLWWDVERGIELLIASVNMLWWAQFELPGNAIPLVVRLLHKLVKTDMLYKYKTRVDLMMILHLATTTFICYGQLFILQQRRTPNQFYDTRCIMEIWFWHLWIIQYPLLMSLHNLHCSLVSILPKNSHHPAPGLWCIRRVAKINWHDAHIFAHSRSFGHNGC